MSSHNINMTLQTKGQMPADKDIVERHVKLQADSRPIHGGRDSITIFIGLKENWCQSRPHMRFIVAMALKAVDRTVTLRDLPA